MSLFSEISLLPPNVVLGLNAECVADPFPDKINLTIGAYRDNDGKPVVLESVRQAETFIFESHFNNGIINFYCYFYTHNQCI